MIVNTKEVTDKDFSIKRLAEEIRSLSFKDHICIGCGICESSCPVSAITLGDIGAIIRADGPESKLAIKEDECVLCGICSGVCPANALIFSIDNQPISEIPSYPKYDVYAEIDDDKCIYCQKCEIACPREAITIARSLPDRSKLVTGEIDIDKETCVYCGICEELCPADAIDIDRTPESESISVDKDKCVYCLVCKKACPVTAIKASCRICSYGDYDINLEDAVIKGSSFIDDELCIKCGWCEGVCPTEAAKVKKPFVGVLDIHQDICTACGTCVDICPCDVLSFPKPAKSGDIVDNVAKDEQYCIKCGACAKVCPVDAIDVQITGVDYTPTKSKSWSEKFEALKS
jgi:4Fe-4S ferredoxin